jgi:competence ComEA-like helix-hairpin-helix protein
MTRNEQRLVVIFLIVTAAGLLFLFLNRYRFYYNYVKIALHEGEKSGFTGGENSADIGKRKVADGAARGRPDGDAGRKVDGGEETAAGVRSPGVSGGPASGAGENNRRVSGAVAPSGKIDINRAGLDELISLPGIGRVTALNIIEYRTRTGGFKDVMELIEVQGIGRKKLAAVLEHVVVE